MEFRQPNTLARTLHLVLNEVLAGQSLTMSFGSEEEVRRVLAVLQEVATERMIGVTVRAVGPRSLELTMVEEEEEAA